MYISVFLWTPTHTHTLLRRTLKQQRNAWTCRGYKKDQVVVGEQQQPQQHQRQRSHQVEQPCNRIKCQRQQLEALEKCSENANIGQRDVIVVRNNGCQEGASNGATTSRQVCKVRHGSNSNWHNSNSNWSNGNNKGASSSGEEPKGSESTLTTSAAETAAATTATDTAATPGVAATTGEQQQQYDCPAKGIACQHQRGASRRCPGHHLPVQFPGIRRWRVAVPQGAAGH